MLSVAIHVSISPSLSLCFSSSIRPSHSLWRDMNCVLSERGQWHISPPVWTVSFRSLVTLYANRRRFVRQNVSTRLQNCAQGKGRWQRCSCSPSLPPSLPLSLCLSLYLSLSSTERSLFGSLPLPLRLFPLPGHRCEATQTPEGFHTSGSLTHTGKTEHKHKQTQAITTLTAENTCSTDAPSLGWWTACEIKKLLRSSQ